MKDKKQEKAEEISKELGKLYDDMLDALPVEELLPHFRAEIKVLKKIQVHDPRRALPPDKLAALEKAVDEFQSIYEAEKAEAEKMPLSRHEADRLRSLFAEADEWNFSPDPRRRTLTA